MSVRINDKLLVWIMFGAMAVLSAVTIEGNRDARDAARAAEIAANKAEEAAGFATLLRDCQTPGTECYKFRAENDKKEREYFVSLVKGANLCVLITSGAVNSGEIAHDIAVMEEHYSQCIMGRTTPEPGGETAVDE